MALLRPAPRPAAGRAARLARVARVARAAAAVRLAGALAGALAAPAAAAQAPAQGAGAPAGAPAADLVIVNARIRTADAARPLARALAVRGDRLAFVGDSAGAVALRGPATRVVDLGGRPLLPGLTDAHGHLLGLGLFLAQVDLTGARSYDEVVARVARRARELPPGAWVVGRGWDQNAWGDTRFPTHDKLSAAVPDRPAWLVRVDGHAGLANAEAMRRAGVTAGTRDPAGGRVERDGAGAPAGVFVDNAQALVARAVPPPTREAQRQALRAAAAELHRWGLTGVHDAGEPRATIELMEEMAGRGELDLRTYVMVGDDSAALRHYFARGPRSAIGGGRLWVRAVKLYADGALGSRGAALLEPYSDDPANTGLLVSAPAHIRDVAARALAAGFQVNTHAIGDRGNRLVLDAYEAALRERPTADHRFRVEHAQVLHHDDVPRFAALGVIPSMQASHQTSDMYWAGARLGEGRLAGAYAWRSLIDAGSIVPNGSDFPVEPVDPLRTLRAAVARQDAAGWPAGGWHPEQRMTADEALRSMTLWPAVAAFQERDLGTLAAGKYADFVVFDRDPFTAPAAEVARARVLATYVGGRAVYQTADAPR